MKQKESIRRFIQSNLLVLEEDTELKDSDNIFELGYVNSLFAIKLLNYVEKEFGVKVSNEELNIKNFSSIDNITGLVEKKLTVQQ